eukprot:CAMPEP_0185566230 /NCGR_PEP_ID=MMETSP1381-20130426/66007_1 /TAXON_ID=298111 /ORGANISM="Pavlova sp., Strain CCMP459" /LENGTH=97 /DNA_ID=CAMNT_0028180179 /DNA_START=809 /DNA_END=1102 /DNA_ORIENTATION=-
METTAAAHHSHEEGERILVREGSPLIRVIAVEGHHFSVPIEVGRALVKDQLSILVILKILGHLRVLERDFDDLWYPLGHVHTHSVEHCAPLMPETAR